MTDLIARLVSAQEGSIDLSIDVLRALGWTTEEVPKLGTYWYSPSGECHFDWDIPRPTRDLNDALQLVPEKLVWEMSGADLGCVSAKIMRRCRYTAEDGRVWTQFETLGSTSEPGVLRVHTPPVALCIAILKALSHQNQGEEVG